MELPAAQPDLVAVGRPADRAGRGGSDRKLFPLEIAGRTWLIAWVGGSVAVGLLAGCIWTLVRRHTDLDAAIEIDLRYGLKERVSSALALSSAERSSEVGQALVDDANHRVQRIDVREQFRPEWNWYPLLPLVTAVLVFLVAFFVPDATRDQAAASADTAGVNEQVRKSMQELEETSGRTQEDRTPRWDCRKPTS